jgi:hypothetical protein
VSSPTRPDSAKPLCAETSRAHAEPLHATASRVDTWILIEYRGLWAHDAVDGSTLSRELKAFLVEERRRLPHARILFVRRNERRSRDGLLAYVAHSSRTQRGLRCLELDRHDDLVGLDLGAAGEPVEHPLFLVCTHGKHDRCCAKFGRPLYDAVGEQVEDGWAWQSSHIGGDRFAGNLVCLPEGLYYGRVDRETAGAVLDEHLARRIWMDNYRGRSIYTFAVQAAERYVREREGLRGIDDLALQSVVPAGGAWRVSFTAGSESIAVRVVDEPGDLTLMTCSSGGLERPRRYVVSPG